MRDAPSHNDDIQKSFLLDTIEHFVAQIDTILREEDRYYETEFYQNLANMSLLSYIKNMQKEQHSLADLKEISSTLDDVIRLYEQEKSIFLAKNTQAESLKNIFNHSNMQLNFPDENNLFSSEIPENLSNEAHYSLDVERLMSEITQKVIQEMGNHNINAIKQNNRHVSNMLRQQQKKFDAILEKIHTPAEIFSSQNSDLRSYVTSLKADIYAERNILLQRDFVDVLRYEEIESDLAMFVEALEMAEENGDREAFFRIRDDFRSLRRTLHAEKRENISTKKKTDENDSDDV